MLLHMVSISLTLSYMVMFFLTNKYDRPLYHCEYTYVHVKSDIDSRDKTPHISTYHGFFRLLWERLYLRPPEGALRGTENEKKLKAITGILNPLSRICPPGLETKL